MSLKKFTRIFIFVVFLGISLSAIHNLPLTRVEAQDCGTDLQCQIDQIQREIDALSPAHEKNKEELAGLKKQLDDLNKRLGAIANQLKKLQAEINQREEDLAFAQAIFEEKANNHYKFLRLYDPLLPF